MKVNMQPPPEDPFCGGARRAETPRPVDIKRDGGDIPSTLPHNFHLPPTSSRSLLFSTGASSASHPLGSGASASRARARRFSGARCNLWVPAANRCWCRWRDERNLGRTRRDAGGSDPRRRSDPSECSSGRSGSLVDVRAPRTRASARVSGTSVASKWRLVGHSPPRQTRFVFVVARARAGGAFLRPSGSHSPHFGSARSSEETSRERDRPRLHPARFARTPPSCSSRKSVPP